MSPEAAQILEKRGYKQNGDGTFSRIDSHGSPAARVTKPEAKPTEKKAPVPRGPSPLAAKFEDLWALLKGPELTPEFKFHKTRKWRFDYCHERTRVAIELDGGIFGGKSRHTTCTGFQKDCDKTNAAAEDGYFVFRLATGMVTADRLETIIRTIKRLSYL